MRRKQYIDWLAGTFGIFTTIYSGFYASISGNYIALYDLSIKYELFASLSRKQILASVALLFGE